MRPILRPGSHVLRRGDGELQIGLDPRTAVVLPDDEEVRGCLDRLARQAELGEYADRRILDLLEANGLLLDAGTLLPLIPACRPTGVPRRDVAALARTAGDGAAELLSARPRSRVSVLGFGDPADGSPVDDLTALLAGAGLPVRVGASREDDRLGVLVGVGEPDRDLLDGWMRTGTAHLVVRFVEGSATVGPFVVPGQTACLRCVDAHHTDADPCWPLLVAQYSSLTRRERADGVPEPVDGLLAEVALAWAAHDLAGHAEGRSPSTWSGTVRFDPQLTAVETRTWLRHPACGCTWG